MQFPVSAEAACMLAAHSGLTTSTALGLGGGRRLGKEKMMMTVQGVGCTVRLPSVLWTQWALHPSAPPPGTVSVASSAFSASTLF